MYMLLLPLQQTWLLDMVFNATFNNISNNY